MRLPESPRTLPSLLGQPASTALIERFSQRASFAHLLTERSPRAHASKGVQPASLSKPLLRATQRLSRFDLADSLRGTRREQLRATAQLTLLLSAQQKALLLWLASHPLLTPHNLTMLLYPGHETSRLIQRHMRLLHRLGLIISLDWEHSTLWQDRERYLLSEPALRYLALRQSLPTTYYLVPPRSKKNNGELWIQQGVAGLFAQMQHTHGLYQSLSCLLEQHADAGPLLLWHSAHEAIRWYQHPFTQQWMQIRPDAELLVQSLDADMPSVLLVEYDRGTSSAREYEAKFEAYADYQRYTQIPLPHMLVIVPNERTARRLAKSLANVAPHLRLTVVLEEHIQYQHLLDLLLQPV
jgi:hypothetical protein